MAQVGNLEIDIGLKLASLDANIAQANAKLSQFGRQATTSLGGIEKAAGGLERGLSFLTKFGLGVGGGLGLAGLVTHITHLAERLADTNPEAKKFSESMERVQAVVNSGFVVAFGAINPFLDTMATAAEGAAQKVNDLANAWAHYKAEHPAAAGLSELFNPLTGGTPGAGAIQGKIDREGYSNSGTVIRMDSQVATLKALRENEIYQQQQAEKEAQKKIADDKYKAWKAEFDNKQKMLQEYLDEERSMQDANEKAEAARQERLDRIGTMAAEGAAKADAAFNEAAKKADEAATKRADAFGNLFVENMVQAADGGFKAILKSWELTLVQMLVKAQLADLGKAVGGWAKGAEAGGGWLGGVVSGASKLFGFANGGEFNVGGSGGTDSQLVAFKATPGEHVSVGGGGSNVVNIVQNVDARGATDPRQIAMAMRLAKDAALAEFRDVQRRSR